MLDRNACANSRQKRVRCCPSGALNNDRSSSNSRQPRGHSNQPRQLIQRRPLCIRTPLAALIGMMARVPTHASASWAERGISARKRHECRRCGRQLALPQSHQTDAASGRSPAGTTAKPVQLCTKPCSVAEAVYDVGKRPTLSGCRRIDERASWPGPRWSDSARVLSGRVMAATTRQMSEPKPTSTSQGFAIPVL